MEGLIADFLAVNRRRWSPRTIENYGWYLQDMARCLPQAHSSRGARRVTQRMLAAWLDGHPGWSPATAYTAILACRSFFAWAVGPDRSPAKDIALPKRVRSPHRVFDYDKYARLLQALDTSTPKGRRDLAIITLLTSSALRSAELCRLQVRHVDLTDRRLSVICKGGKWQDRVFGHYACACLAAWFATRDSLALPDACQEVFVSLGGNTMGKPLTTSGLRVIFREMGQKVGFHFSPHDFRHTFATWGIRNGGPTLVVGRAGGWGSVHEVETRYAQTITAKDMEPYDPVDRFMDATALDMSSPLERLIAGRH